MVLKQWKLNSLKKKIAALVSARRDGNPSEADIAKEIGLHHQLAALYDALSYNNKHPYAKEYALESYRIAASLNDAQAQFVLGKRRLELGKFWDRFRETGMQVKVHQKYAKDAYEEAFTFLEAADNAEHPEAKRLLGLAYINGWGVDKDEERGSKLIVDSIELEKAWDRAPQILEEIGMNKPEFFESLMRQKASRT